MLEFRTQNWKWSREMVKALVTKPEYNLGSLSVLPLSPGQKNTEGYWYMSIPSAFILKKKKVIIPKDWSLNSHLVNLVLTEIWKNPSSMVYGHKTQLIWKPFPRWYSAAREDPSISMQSPLLVLTAVWQDNWETAIQKERSSNRVKCCISILRSIFLRIVGTLTYHLLCDEK